MRSKESDRLGLWYEPLANEKQEKLENKTDEGQELEEVPDTEENRVVKWGNFPISDLRNNDISNKSIDRKQIDQFFDRPKKRDKTNENIKKLS